jgi:hypothetical protein
MKLHSLTLLFSCFFVILWARAFADSGLKEEFSRRGLVLLPVNQSTLTGFSFDPALSITEGDETEDDLFSDFTGVTSPLSLTGFFSSTKINRLICLKEATHPASDLEAASSDAPYLHVKSKKWDLGFGAQRDVSWPGPLTMGGISISFLKGKNYFSVQSLNHKDEERGPLELPLTKETLEAWRVGDQIFYASQGGIALNVFLGTKTFIAIGPEYSHLGSYRVRVELMADSLIEVEVTVTETDSLGLELSSIPLEMEMTKGQGPLEATIYQFDLTSAEAFQGLNHLLQGRLDLTNQQMLKSNGKITLSTKINHEYATFSGKYGVPFIFVANSGLSFFEHEGFIRRNEAGHASESQVFSALKRKSFFTTGLLSKQKWFTETVASIILKEEEGPLINSSYAWSFSSEKMQQKALTKRLSKLADAFALPALRKLRLPAGKPRYVKTDFTIGLNGQDILYLLEPTNLQKMLKESLEILEEDFERLGHRQFCKLRSYHKCFKRYKNKLYAKTELLQNHVGDIEDLYKRKKLNDMVASVTRLMNTLFTSRYLTQRFVTHRPRLNLELRIEGENIKRHYFGLGPKRP